VYLSYSYMNARIVEVTGNVFGTPFPLTLDINKPENCQAAKASGASPSISEHSVYNEGGAAFAMIEYGWAGLRVFDLRDGDHPKEVAYFVPAVTSATAQRCVKVHGTDRCKVAIQTNNVEVDERGYIYLVDRADTGLHIVELTGTARAIARLP